MTADKRTVSTDALETLGMIHTREEKRDAIHLAVLPVEAGEKLSPGEHLYLKDGKAFGMYGGGPTAERTAIGIVDPFLVQRVKPGERFWLVIFPRVITSLRHVWTHPQLPDEVGVSAVKTENQQESEDWLRNWCSRSDITYDHLLEFAKRGVVDSGEDRDYYGRHLYEYQNYGGNEGYLFGNGTDAHGVIPAEVWDHVKIVIGQEPIYRPLHFSCSC